MFSLKKNIEKSDIFGVTYEMNHLVYIIYIEKRGLLLHKGALL